MNKVNSSVCLLAIPRMATPVIAIDLGWLDGATGNSGAAWEKDPLLPRGIKFTNKAPAMAKVFYPPAAGMTAQRIPNRDKVSFRSENIEPMTVNLYALVSRRVNR